MEPANQYKDDLYSEFFLIYKLFSKKNANIFFRKIVLLKKINTFL